jgi:hypothetical protein
VHNYLCEIDALLFWELIAGPYILILTYAIVSTIRRRRRVTFLAVSLTPEEVAELPDATIIDLLSASFGQAFNDLATPEHFAPLLARPRSTPDLAIFLLRCLLATGEHHEFIFSDAAMRLMKTPSSFFNSVQLCSLIEVSSGRCRATEVGVLKKHLDFVLLQCHTVQSQFWSAVLRLSRSSILDLVFQMHHRVLNTLNFFKQMDVTESNSFREFAVKSAADLELVDPDTISDRPPEARRRHRVAAPLMTERSTGWPPLVRLGPMTAADSTPEQFPALNDQQIQGSSFTRNALRSARRPIRFGCPATTSTSSCTQSLSVSPGYSDSSQDAAALSCSVAMCSPT